jgi:hypothetical protein
VLSAGGSGRGIRSDWGAGGGGGGGDCPCPSGAVSLTGSTISDPADTSVLPAQPPAACNKAGSPPGSGPCAGSSAATNARWAVCDRGCDLGPESFGDPAPRPHRRRGLGKRPPRTQLLTAQQAALAPPQLHRLTGRRQILDPHHRPVLHRRGQHPADRARPLPGRQSDLT